MTEADFRSRRRQRFLTEKYFELNRRCLVRLIEDGPKTIERRHAQGKLKPVAEEGMVIDTLKLLRLNYTSGETIASLAPIYADVIQQMELWHRAEHQYSVDLARRSGQDLRLDQSPLDFVDLTQFQLALDVVSLGILFGDGESVRRIASMMQSTRGSDMLMEYLLESVVENPCDIEEFFHERPYGLLIDAIYTADTPEESIAYVQKYLDGWYKAFEGAPWHNGHLVQTEEYSNYEGYWAFEAAAVCVLKGIDDSSFRDHLVYPKDLADWARAHKVPDAIRWRGASEAEQALRCEAGRPCPREGWWRTPAAAGKRQRFAQGDVMPDVGGAYGATIWQWDEQQGN